MINIRDLHHNYKDYDGKVVTIGGWVRSIRDSKTFGFMVVNDGTFFEPVQVVYADKLDNFETICKLNVGAAVIVTGQVKVTPEMKQPFEIHADEVVIEGESTPDYPLQKKRHSFEYLRTYRYGTVRYLHQWYKAVFSRIRLSGKAIPGALCSQPIPTG